MELASWMPWLEAASKIATLSAAGLAVWGINAWRRDFTGKRRIELAEETLVLFYRSADAVRAMRSPGSYEVEFEHIVQKEGESPHSFTARKIVAPLFKRHEEYSELFASLQATRYRYMARFGQESGQPFVDLHRLVVHILVTARHYAMVAGQYDPDGNPIVVKNQQAMREQQEAVFWDMGETDDINLRLDAIVDLVERQCRRIIESQSKFSILRREALDGIRAFVAKAKRRIGRFLPS
ncbi:hypothetical protein [Cupriavidus sp.]|uniref:hypothetical protein n=1 Tax=Cupriavidus sp. TaxID=1873897 RepID=UPI003D147D53